MSRLRGALRADVLVQRRQGYWAAAAFVAAMWTAIAKALPGAARADVLATLVLGSATITTFYFVAGLVLYERSERVLDALAVTPLRSGEYLASKVLTLTVLALVEALAVAGLVRNGDVRWLWLVAGVVLLGTFYTLLGVVVVARYDSVNKFVMPSVLWVAVSQLPLLDSLHLWSPVFLLAWPTAGGLVLVTTAFGVEPTWRDGLAVAWALVAMSGLFVVARRAVGRLVCEADA